MPGLFRVWLHKLGARLMGVESIFCDLIGAKSIMPSTAPTVFSLDEEPARLGLPSHVDSNHARAGKAPLRAAWWHATWAAACGEVRRRYGQLLHVKCTGVEEDGAGGRQVELDYTMGEIYELLHTVPREPEAQRLRESELRVLWAELDRERRWRGDVIKDEELGRFRGHNDPSLKADSIFDAKTVATTWRHLVLAVEDGRWKAIDHPGAPKPAPGPAAATELQDIPSGEVKSFADGWYKWRGFWQQAWSPEDGYQLLNTMWHEQQRRHAIAQQMQRERRQQLQALEAEDARHARGDMVVLRHPHYKPEFRGRLRIEGRKAIFVEDATWVEVQVDVASSRAQTGHDLRKREVKLYNAMRGEHAKANRKASLAARQQALQAQLPTAPGDMAVRRKTDAGKLIYAWQDLEVEATPRSSRAPVTEAESHWKQARARETTPERGLRKMRTKVKTRLSKAAKGEHARIVVRAESTEPPPAGAADPAGELGGPDIHQKCPALKQLNDPVSLAHTRAAYEFLDTLRLHHCQNCDEEWPVFDGEWPQGGVACAGPRAGKSETIARAGWTASWAKEDLCSRCASSAVYRTMYSEANLQHLGPRSEALSNLTWYESLLIARVHPVISVVTLTATGLLCYAGHVCNYYVKVLEWFRELPAILRDKKWFLIKRRRSINASASDTRQKKPTTANRQRLEAAIAVAQQRLPNVFRDSVVVPDALAKYPTDGELEMLEQEERVDLRGDVRVDREMFLHWLSSGEDSRGQHHCALALQRCARDQLSAEDRGDDMRAVAWDLCCRSLSRTPDARTLGTSELAQLLVYWLEEGLLPAQMRQAIYTGMQEELLGRGKRVETAGDEQAMMSRWVKQLMHGELEACLSNCDHLPVDLDVDCEMLEPQQPSMTAEAEGEAGRLLSALKAMDLGAEVDVAAGRTSADAATTVGSSTLEGEWHGVMSESAWEGEGGAGDEPGEVEAAWNGEGEGEGEGGDASVAAGPGVPNPDKPLVDPPEFGDRVRDTDKEPYWIPGAFPTIFQNETGDPYNYVLKEVDLVTWGPHVLRSKGWIAQAHMTFMYWWVNMVQRFHALSAKKWFVRDNPRATGYTVEELKNMSVTSLAKQMVGYTSQIPGTKASKARLRKVILAMVRQLEIETRRPAAGHLGDVPCLFGTLTSQRYRWDEVIRIIALIEGIHDYKSLSRSKRRELVNKYPLFVAWYCAVRLELSLKAIVVPLFGASAYVAVFEWSPTGGMVHLHYILWKPGAPRFDIRAERLMEQAEALRKAGLVAKGVARCKVDDVVDFFAQYVSEWNPNKAADGSEETGAVAQRVNEEQENHTAAVSVEEMLRLLQEDAAEERFDYYKRLVRTEHMHDFHFPDPCGAPNPSQPCAKLLKGTLNMWYCANGYPRDLVREPCEQSVAQDALRPDLWRVGLCRNCQLMNCHMPLASVGTQSNTDAQPVPTKNQAEMYCCKYCSKHLKNSGARSALFDVLDDMELKDKAGKEKYGDSYEERKLGGKLHRAFMAEIGEEMCQAEVAHHANRCPEYLCSRPERSVHLYKKALALNTEPKKGKRGGSEDDTGEWCFEEDAEGGDGRKLATKPSDLELYERRTWYRFSPGTDISESLPARETAEEQVAAANLYDFFRLVQFHGGRNPYLSWHAPLSRPVVTMSPVVKMREGPDFAFAARWGLMQYHAWEDRRLFLDMTETEVKEYFRTWLDAPDCPWYVRDQYLAENSRKLRGVRPARRGAAKGDLQECEAGVQTEVAGDTSVEACEGDDEEGPAALVASDTEESSEEEPDEPEEDTRVLKMLYKGNMEEVNRRVEQQRRAKVISQKHSFYKQTRCTSTAQEEQSALPAGVLNVHEDSSGDEDYFGEQKD